MNEEIQRIKQEIIDQKTAILTKDVVYDDTKLDAEIATRISRITGESFETVLASFSPR